MKRSTLACIALFAAIGCSSDEPIGPDGAIDFEGTWSGDLGDPNLLQRIGVTWTPTHTHNSVVGPIKFRLNETLTATGTLSGKVIGTLIEFTLTVGVGGYPAPISQTCTLAATGSSSTATATSIVALLAMNWSPPCLGSVTGVTNANHRLTLVKLP